MSNNITIKSSFKKRGLIFVESKSDLPASINGVITLKANTEYYFTTSIDLLGDRIVCGENTVISGTSSESCVIKSTGLTGTLISSSYSLPIRHVSFTGNHQILDLDGTGNPTAAIDWYAVNFVNCVNVGSIRNYTNIVWSDMAFLEAAGLIINGTTGTVSFFQCLFDATGNNPVITIPSATTITRRFRVLFSSFIINNGEIGINFSANASVPVEGYILDTINFSGGGTYITGIEYSDNKCLWSNCRGVSNSGEIGFMTMQDNITPTIVLENSQVYKVLGATVAQDSTQKFTHTNNRLTYTGAITRFFKITTTATLLSGNNHQIGLYIAKNGSAILNSENYCTTNSLGRAEATSCQTVLKLQTNDYIEIFVENATSATNITVEFMSVIIEALN